MHEKTIDREMGELVASVKALTQKIDDDKHRMEQGFHAMGLEIEKLSKQFTEYKTVHDNQSKIDYGYMDEKLSRLDNRVATIELVHSEKDKGAWAKFKVSMLDMSGKMAIGGIFAAVIWIVIEYLRKGAP